MLIPAWFLWVWAAASFLNGAASLAALRARKWALFSLCGHEVVVFALLARHIPYRQYFVLYFVNQAIHDALKIWLAWEVLCCLPAHRLIPARWIAPAALLSGLTCAVILHPPQTPSLLQGGLLYVDRCVTFTWAAVLIVCLFGVVAAGFGFTLSALRIATGMIVRLLSAMTLSVVVTTPCLKAGRSVMTTLDTVIAGMVALYWAYAAWKAPRNRAERLEELGFPQS